MQNISPPKPAPPSSPRPPASAAGRKTCVSAPNQQVLGQFRPNTRQQASNTLLTGLASLLLRCGGALRSVGGMISGLFIRSQHTNTDTQQTKHPITLEEAHAAVLHKQEITIAYGRYHEDLVLPSEQNLEEQLLDARNNKSENESNIAGLRPTSLGKRPSNKERVTLLQKYLNALAPDPSLPAMPIVESRDNSSIDVGLDYDPIARLFLNLELNQIKAISAKTPKLQSGCIVSELEKVDTAIKRLDTAIPCASFAADSVLLKLYQFELKEYRHTLMEFRMKNISLALKALEDSHGTDAHSIESTYRTTQEGLKKELADINSQLENERTLFDTIKVESNESFWASFSDEEVVSPDRSGELQQKKSSKDDIVSTAKQRREKATTLVPDKLWDNHAKPAKSILKTGAAGSKSARKVGFDVLVEEQSKAGLVADSDPAEISKQKSTIRHISILPQLSEKSTRGSPHLLDPKMRLFQFLASNGLVDSDTALPTNDTGEGIDWSALTETAQSLKTAEQSLPKGNQQFIYWNPKKITLREWALIGAEWNNFDKPTSAIARRAQTLKTQGKDLFKNWDSKRTAFKKWYGKVDYK